MLIEVKRVLGFPKLFRFDPGDFIKLLSSKTKKYFSSKDDAILLWQCMPLPVLRQNVSIKEAAPVSQCKHLEEQQKIQIIEKLIHSFCRRYSDPFVHKSRPVVVTRKE